MYGVLSMEETGLVQYKCEGDYLCCSGQGDWEDEGQVPFLSLLEKLTKSSQALVSTHKS